MSSNRNGALLMDFSYTDYDAKVPRDHQHRTPSMTPEAASAAHCRFPYESATPDIVYEIPYEASQETSVADTCELQSLLAKNKLPKILQHANCLWKQPSRILDIILPNSRRFCLVYVDKRQYVEALQDDMRRPPPIFETDDYDDAVIYREPIYHELIKGSAANWIPPMFPITNSKFRSITKDEGQALEQGKCAFNRKAFSRALDENKCTLVASECYGLRSDLATLATCAFRDEIRARLTYIDRFLMWNSRRSIEEKKPATRPSSPFAYPWLGPNVELDCWLFQRGIARQWEARPDKSDNKAYRPERDLFVCLYGLGRRDLEFLLGNGKADERGEQVATVERFHILQAVLGRAPTADIRAQLSFCSYAIRNARASYGRPPRRFGFAPAGGKSHQELAEDRRREFKIAKVLVDRVWDDLETREVRTLPQQIRHPSDGDWYKLDPHLQKQLLGHDEDLIDRFVYKRSKGPYKS